MSIQPPWNADQAASIIAAHAGVEGPLLPVLHALQEAFGFISDAAVLAVAEALNLSRAEVYGVVSFYHDFRREPPPGRVVKLCRAEACQARGVEAFAPRFEGRFETVYCLGLCASGPSALVDGRPVARLTAEKFEALL